MGITLHPNRHFLCKVFLIILLSIAIDTSAYSQSFDWVNPITGASTIMNISDMVTSNEGDVYITGSVKGTLDFNSTGISVLASSSIDETFLAKYNSTGQCQWLKMIRGGAGRGKALVIDASGDIYLSGYFSNTCDFDPSNQVFNLTAIETDLFITKYSATGNFLFAKHIKGNGTSDVETMTIDYSGNLILGGTIDGTFDFDLSQSTFNSTTPNEDAFVSKYTPDLTLIWVKTFGSSFGDVPPQFIECDKQNNIYFGGTFTDVVDFDPSSAQHIVTSFDIQDSYFVKYDSLGNLLLVNHIGGPGVQVNSNGGVDSEGNVYIVGLFQGTVDFDSSPAVNSLTADVVDFYLAKYNSNGSFQWVKHIENADIQGKRCLVIDKDFDEIYIVGPYSGELVLDTDMSDLPQFPTTPHSFIAKYNSGGKCVYANVIVSSADLRSLNLNNEKDFITSGKIFSSSANFNLNGTPFLVDDDNVHFTASYINCTEDIITSVTKIGSTLTADEVGAYYQWYDCNTGKQILGATQQSFTPSHSGEYKVSVGKEFCTQMSAFTSVGFASIDEAEEKSMRIYPNPTADLLFIENIQYGTYKIISADGKIMQSAPLNNHIIDVSNYSNGLYVLQINSEVGEIYQYKFLKN